jgi:hypothetical protein
MKSKATAAILEMVNEIKKTAPKGEAFFDALDECLSSTTNRWLITSAINAVPKSHTLILSGGFGKTVAELIDAGWLEKREYVLFAGGVRSGKGPVILRKTSKIGKRATFIDDSIYGGATYYIIRDFIKAGGELPIPTKCFVIYDGCPVTKPYVKSLFRYYDFFQATPNFKF